MLAPSARVGWEGAGRAKKVTQARTGTETRAATERTARPEVPVHDAGPHELEEDVERVLELVRQPRVAQRGVHRPRQVRMCVRVQQEPVLQRRLAQALNCAQRVPCDTPRGRVERKHVPAQLQEAPDDIRHDLVFLVQALRRLDLGPRRQLLRHRRAKAQREVNRRRLRRRTNRPRGGSAELASRPIKLLSVPQHAGGRARQQRSKEGVGRCTHVLSPQLFLNDRVGHVPARHALRELRCLRRIVRDRLRWRGLLEPEVACHFARLPERVEDAHDECQRGRPGPGLPVRDHLLHESPVFGRLTVVERRILDDLACGEPYQRLRSQQATREVEIDFVGQSVGEDLVQIRRDVRRGRVVVVVVRVPMGRRGVDGKRERRDGTFG
ncbi:hypothetical protein GY45DRAFT_444496 [Cubamyces sp. BRFM 1775]|nr:hypothetical protein GY45DRAFT_444496 [Cubamyces sp. BRFM 1775]